MHPPPAPAATLRSSNQLGQLAARYHNSRRSLRAWLLSDYDFYVAVKRIQKMHRVFHGEFL
jgi:hypothetical protein